MNDPQSLHKYAYVHGDPISGTDPSGHNLFLANLGTAIHKEINLLYKTDRFLNRSSFGVSLPFIGNAILPDIVDFSLGQIGEIKPLSPYGLYSGPAQLAAAITVANGVPFVYRGEEIIPPLPVPHSGPQSNWIPSDWQPGIRVVWPGRQNPYFAPFVAITLFNIAGVIYYHRIRLPNSAVHGLAAEFAVELKAIQIGESIIESLQQEISNGIDTTLENIIKYRFEIALGTAFAGGAIYGAGTIVSVATSTSLAISGMISALTMRTVTV